MRIHVYNPYNDQKSGYLGLTSFILFSKIDEIKLTPLKSFQEKQARELDEKFRRSLGLNSLDENIPSQKSPIPSFLQRSPGSTSFFKSRIHSSHTPPKLNALLNTGPGWDKSGGLKRPPRKLYDNSEDLFGILQDTLNEKKKLKPNWINEKGDRGIKEEKITFNLSKENSNSLDADLQKVLKESEEMYKKESFKRKERMKAEEEYEKNLISSTKKQNRKESYDEDTYDMEDYHAALKASLQEAEGTEVKVFDEETEEGYLHMLEGCAIEGDEEESQEIDIKIDEKEEKSYSNCEDMFIKKEEEKETKEDSDVLTEIIEDSMANLWNERDEIEVKKEEDEMEIEFEMDKRYNNKGRNKNKYYEEVIQFYY